MVQKSTPLLVFFSRLSTCSYSSGMPASRETMCGESEQAPGEKYSFMTRTSWGPRLGAVSIAAMTQAYRARRLKPQRAHRLPLQSGELEQSWRVMKPRSFDRVLDWS